MEKGKMMLVSCSIKNFQDFIYFNIILSPGREVLKTVTYAKLQRVDKTLFLH